MKIFEYDSPVFSFIRKAANIILLSALFLVVCLPLVTILPAVTALYETVRKNIKDNRDYTIRLFLRTFASNIRVTLPAGILFVLLEALFQADSSVMHVFLTQGHPAGGLYFAFRLLQCITVVWMIWAGAVAARFESSLKDVLKNSFLLLWKNGIKSLCIGIITAAAVAAVLIVPLCAVIVPVVAMWLILEMTERVFLG